MQKTKILSPLDYIPPEICCARDYEQLAPQFISADRLAYIANGSGEDITLRRNQKSFEQFALTPRHLKPTEQGSTQTRLFDKSLQHPFLLAPVAYHKLVHEDAELATCHAADSMETGLISSSLASTLLEDTAPKSEAEQRWFQLYAQDNETLTFSILERAVKSGYQAIVVTLDTALQAPSHQTIRSGFRLPDNVQPLNLNTHLNKIPVTNTPNNQPSIFQQRHQKFVSIELLEKIVETSPVPVLAKGVLTADEALKLKSLGLAGIVVSNHGGRTIDGAPASLTVLPTIRQAIGNDYPVLFDSGIRSGRDIFTAIASGADAVLVGRLQLYSLSVAGALGVAHMIKLLKQELEFTMAMTGCRTIQDIRNFPLLRVQE